MKKTITQVAEKPRIWEGGQHGPLAFINVTFADGDQGSVSTKPEYADSHIAALAALKDKEQDFELEAKDPHNGIAQWKVKTYPGKPGGGFKGNGQRSGKSPEERASIEKQVALKAAVEYVAVHHQGTPPQGVVGVAEVFFAYLQGSSSGAAQSEGGAAGLAKDSSPPAPEPSGAVASTRLGKAGEAAASDSTSGGEPEPGGPGSSSEHDHVYVRGSCKVCGEAKP